MSDVVASETLLPGEPAADAGVKLNRVAQAFLAEWRKSSGVQVILYGYLPPEIDFNPQLRRDETDKMRERLRSARDRLIALGVPDWKLDIAAPGTVSSTMPRKVFVTVYRESRPTILLPFPSTPSAPALEHPPHAEGPPEPETGANVIVDTEEQEKDKDGKNLGKDVVSTQVKIAVVEAGTGNKRIYPKIELGVTAGSGKRVEAEGEVSWEAWALKLEKQFFWGSISEVELAVTVGATVSVKRNAAEEWAVELKTRITAAIKAVVKIPFLIKVPIELSAFADPVHGAGGQLKVTVLRF